MEASYVKTEPPWVQEYGEEQPHISELNENESGEISTPGAIANLNNHTGGLIYECPECHEDFSSRSGLHDHTVSASFSCLFCSESFCSLTVLQQHQHSHIEVADRNQSASSCIICGKLLLYGCGICQHKFCERIYYQEHNQTHNVNQTIVSNRWPKKETLNHIANGLSHDDPFIANGPFQSPSQHVVTSNQFVNSKAQTMIANQPFQSLSQRIVTSNQFVNLKGPGNSMIADGRFPSSSQRIVASNQVDHPKGQDSSLVSDGPFPCTCPVCQEEFPRLISLYRHLKKHLHPRYLQQNSPGIHDQSLNTLSAAQVHVTSAPHIVKILKTTTKQPKRLQQKAVAKKMAIVPNVPDVSIKNSIMTVKPKSDTPPKSIQRGPRAFCPYGCIKWYQVGNKHSMEKHIKKYHHDLFLSDKKLVNFCHCDWCGLQFFSFLDLLKHKRTNHFKHHHFCEICGEKFKFDTFHRHIQKIMKRRKACIPCKTKFKEDRSYRVHMQKVHDVYDREYNCCHCKETFMSLVDFKKHVNAIRLGDAMVACSIKGCGMWLENHIRLNGHMRQHIKQYQCVLCKKRTETPCKRHMSSLSPDGRVHVCAVCGLCLASTEDLQMHAKTHFTEDHDKCPTCVAGYCQSDELHRHLNDHANILTEAMLQKAVKVL